MNVQKDGKELTGSDKAMVVTVGGIIIGTTAILGAFLGMTAANLINGK